MSGEMRAVLYIFHAHEDKRVRFFFILEISYLFGYIYLFSYTAAPLMLFQKWGKELYET